MAIPPSVGSRRPLPPPPPPVRREPPPAQRPATQPRVNTQAQTQGSVAQPQQNFLSGQSSFQAGGSRVEASGTGPGGINTSAYAQGPSFEANASVEGHVGLSGIDVNLNVD